VTPYADQGIRVVRLTLPVLFGLVALSDPLKLNRTLVTAASYPVDAVPQAPLVGVYA